MSTVIPIVGSERVPPVIARALLPHERRVITARPHPAVLFAPSLVAVGGLVVAAILSFLNLSDVTLGIIWFLWGLALLYLLLCLARYPAAYFVVTSQRLLLVRGFMKRDVITVPLFIATELGLRRSFPGRLLGYGEFILYGANARQAIRHVNFVPYPEQLYLEIAGLIFKDPGTDDDY